MAEPQAFFQAANHPCTDPLGVLYWQGSRVMRAIYPHKSAYVRKLFETGLINELIKGQFLGEQWLADDDGVNYDCVVESKPAPFPVPPAMYTRETLHHAAMLWIELAIKLNRHGLYLSDAHYGNYQLFNSSRPKWVDLGSIQPRPQEPASLELILDCLASELLAPLQILVQRPDQEHIVRWIIDHASTSGPMHASGMNPVSVSEISRMERIDLWRPSKGKSWINILHEAREFTSTLKPDDYKVCSEPIKIAVDANQWLKEWLNSRSVNHVMAIGVDNGMIDSEEFLPVPQLCIIEPDQARLNSVMQIIGRKKDNLHIICGVAHPINRTFFKLGLKSEWVLAIDAFERWQHHSPIWWENILVSLHALAKKGVLVVWRDNLEVALQELLTRLNLLFQKVETHALDSGGVVLVAEDPN